MNSASTALVSCFARAYHSNYKYKIYNDVYAKKILTEKEYSSISTNMEQGISFFNKDFKGTNKEALRYIVDNQLSPSVLGRSIFNETELKNEIKLGCKQYLVFASGYDTSAYKFDIKSFELDKESVIKDKIKRVNNANIKNNTTYIGCDLTTDFKELLLKTNYNKDIKSFCSLLGISYYLKKEQFIKLLDDISSIISDGSAIVFDYQTNDKSKETELNETLAQGAGELMKSKYDVNELQKLVGNSNLLMYKNLDSTQMTNQYFGNYNNLNPNNKIVAPVGVNYCLLIKKELNRTF